MLPGAKGLKAPLSCLSQARFGIGWGAIGAAMDCYETARQYTILRKQFDDCECRLPRFCSRVAFPWADDFVGNPTAIEITRLWAHGLAIDEALDAAGIEGKVA